MDTKVLFIKFIIEIFIFLTLLLTLIHKKNNNKFKHYTFFYTIVILKYIFKKLILDNCNLLKQIISQIINHLENQ